MLVKSKYLPIGIGFQVRDDKNILPYPIYFNGIERGWYDRKKHGSPHVGGVSWESRITGLWYYVVPKNLLIFGED